MTTKLSYAFVKQSFEKEGYELLSEHYTNAQINLIALCNKGHTINIPWSNWSRGVRCSKCAGNRRLTVEFIKDEFAKEGYILLSKIYKNSTTKMKYRCSIGHIGYITYGNWYNGKRCPICKLISRSGESHYNWKGGISCEPYCDTWFDKYFKKDIKTRDNYKCQNPDCWKKIGAAGDLTVHHTDYNKKNCIPSNLITLCRSCNVRANFNRDYWQDFYTIIMKDKRLC